jgi:hypothetical protein
MDTYIVRLIESKELVGFIAARNWEHLMQIVDEATDPYSCEYRRATQGGGILWTTPGTPKTDWESEEEFDLSGAEFSDDLMRLFAPDITGAIWKLFPHDCEGCQIPFWDKPALWKNGDDVRQLCGPCARFAREHDEIATQLAFRQLKTVFQQHRKQRKANTK